MSNNKKDIHEDVLIVLVTRRLEVFCANSFATVSLCTGNSFLYEILEESANTVSKVTGHHHAVLLNEFFKLRSNYVTHRNKGEIYKDKADSTHDRSRCK